MVTFVEALSEVAPPFLRKTLFLGHLGPPRLLMIGGLLGRLVRSSTVWYGVVRYGVVQCNEVRYRRPKTAVQGSHAQGCV